MTLRPCLNTALTLPWTVLMSSLGVVAVASSGNVSVFRRLERVWARGLVKSWGVSLEVHGGDHASASRPYIVVCNHQSLVDIPTLFLTLPMVPGFVAKQELARVPFLAAALRAGGHVLIDRQSRKSAIESLDAAAAAIHAGLTVAIFPEGTRSETGSVGKFKTGGFHLAKKALVPILPVGIRGTRAILPKKALLLHPGHVEVRIGECIGVADVERLPVKELAELTRVRIAALSGSPLASA
ncbi:MAG: 1-acyl-sn-glycerol-3-phosphate acyltransferase [Proteobacteria bacterium]|nr:1-acyl-sn-glycerol-3-phosphate acyltransferase [Pseudomonadota bacterium]